MKEKKSVERKENEVDRRDVKRKGKVKLKKGKIKEKEREKRGEMTEKTRRSIDHGSLNPRYYFD